LTNSEDEQMATKSWLTVVKNWSKDVQNLGENWSNICLTIDQIFARKLVNICFKIGQNLGGKWSNI
jgi:hypothetical protein